MTGKCQKHGCWLQTRKMHGGKTMQICPECDAEEYQKIREMFAGKSIDQDLGGDVLQGEDLS